MWRLFVLAILVLLLRRLPVVLALYKFIPAIRTWREAVFTGWFGPIGVGAIFYYSVAIESIPADGPNAHAREVLEPIIYFMVLASVVAHGITIPLFYIGTFATRTLTRTSENGTQVLRIPKIDTFRSRGNKQPSTTNVVIEEKDMTDVHIVASDKGPEQNIDIPVPRHTAITILTPEDIRQKRDNTPRETPSPPSEESTVNTPARRNSYDESHEDSTIYL